jgi:hypothetical protein
MEEEEASASEEASRLVRGMSGEPEESAAMSEAAGRSREPAGTRRVIGALLLWELWGGGWEGFGMGGWEG